MKRSRRRPLVLALDTAGDSCSLALWGGDEDDRAQSGVHNNKPPGECIAHTYCATREGRHASRHVLAMVHEMQEECGIAFAELDALAVNCGPGSFTGVRVGLGVAHGIALAHSLPVITVSALAVLAVAVGGQRVLVALDARLGQVHIGCYRRLTDGDYANCATETLCDVRDIASVVTGIVGAQPCMAICAGQQPESLRAALQQATGPQLQWTATPVAVASCVAILAATRFAKGDY